jgi:hypothetical protein
MPQMFSALNRMIFRDLNANQSGQVFRLYTKEKIQEFLKDPAKNEKNLRDACVYIYGASSHFRRLINYFAGLSDLAYVVSPHKLDTAAAKADAIGKQYRKALNLLAAMDIKNQFAKVLTVCLREDVFYGVLRGSDAPSGGRFALQQLPADACAIAAVEGGVLNVSFDFSYFDRNKAYLEFYSDEFQRKYAAYKRGTEKKWQELDAPGAFAIKCNSDILSYAAPPFAGLLREVYALEDYKQLKLTKTELENYAMLVMKLGLSPDGEWQMDLDKAKEFWKNLDGAPGGERLPAEGGLNPKSRRL